ncbi:MAG: PP2C family protein-serine/threonine phosphatase, partial [Methylococcaceae bacterium]
MQFECGFGQDQGRRDEQQDSFWVSTGDEPFWHGQPGVLALVADGMGGCADGAAASRLAVQAFVKTFGEVFEPKLPEATTPEQALELALSAANGAVYEHSVMIGEEQNCGTTLLACLIYADVLRWVSVGDSRLYHFRNGELVQLSQDHNSSRHCLTSYVGGWRISNIDKSPAMFRVLPGDRVLLCSDGLYGFMDEFYMAASLNEAPQSAVDGLIGEIGRLNHIHQDNVTVVVIKN